MSKNKSILILLLIFTSIFTFGCNKDSNVEDNSSVEEETSTVIPVEEGLKNGVYYENANVTNPCIVVTDDNIMFFETKNTYYANVYEYTVNNDKIDAFNSYSRIEITIDNDNLTTGGISYTFKHENVWFLNDEDSPKIIDPAAFINALSEDDIASAISIATDHYINETFFVKEIVDMQLNQSEYDYYERIINYGADLFAPGNFILLTSEIMHSDDDYTDTRIITLGRTSEDSEWIVLGEGLYEYQRAKVAV